MSNKEPPGQILTLQVERHFEESAEKVFDAWLDPAHAGQWLFATPNGEMLRAEIEARVGGSFVIVEKRGAEVAEHLGTYVEIERPQRLVFDFSTDREQKPTQVTVVIVASEYGCELTLTHEIDAQWADYLERTRSGWTNILEGLAKTLAADREIVTERIIDFARKLVFKAFSQPEHLAKWWGPQGFTNSFQEYDLRPGGHWRFVMHGPDGTDYPNHSVFVEVVEHERIVFRHLDPMHIFQMTILFAKHKEKTKLTWRMMFETPAKLEEVRLFVVKANEENFDRLEAELAVM